MADDINVTLRIPHELATKLENALTKAKQKTPKGETVPSRADIYRTMLYRGLEASK